MDKYDNCNKEVEPCTEKPVKNDKPIKQTFPNFIFQKI